MPTARKIMLIYTALVLSIASATGAYAQNSLPFCFGAGKSYLQSIERFDAQYAKLLSNLEALEPSIQNAWQSQNPNENTSTLWISEVVTGSASIAATLISDRMNNTRDAERLGVSCLQEIFAFANRNFN